MLSIRLLLGYKITTIIVGVDVLDDPLLIKTNQPINQNLIDAFSFEQVAPKEKALQKEKGVLSPARRATAFEKAVQNNPFGSCEQGAKPFDKSKFEALSSLQFSFEYAIIDRQ